MCAITICEVVFFSLPVLQVSGGHLAVLDSEEEAQWLREHLVKHVASNICKKKVNKLISMLKNLKQKSFLTLS